MVRNAPDGEEWGVRPAGDAAEVTVQSRREVRHDNGFAVLGTEHDVDVQTGE